MAEHLTDDPDDSPPPIPYDDCPLLAAKVVTPEDGPAECTLFPADAEESERTTAWLTATGDSFVRPDEMR